MAQQTINLGTVDNDGTGDPLKTSLDKCNDNFTELYGRWESVVDDTTPQLGGDLDVNGNDIVSVSNGNISLLPNGTGNIILGTLTIDGDQTVGAGQDNYVLTYDHSAGTIGLEVVASAPVSSVNTLTGAVVLDPDDLDDTSTTNKFTTAADITKLSGIATAATADAEASASEVRDGTASKYITPAVMHSALAFVTLTDGATVSWDMDTGVNFKVTLGGNRTLANPTNVVEGMSGVLQIIQDATGSRTITWGANYKHAGGTEPTLSTGANAVDTLSWFAESTSSILIAEVGAFS